MYVPILKWKQGEQWACKGLPDNVASLTYPLFEIPPRPVDPKTKAPKKSVEDYLTGIGKNFVDSWDENHTFAVDLTLLEESLDGASSGKSIDRLFKQLRAEGFSPVPVARSDQKPSQLHAISRIASAGHEGLMARCIWEDVNQGTLNDLLDYLLDEVGCAPADIDLVIDLRTVGAENIAGLSVNVARALESLTLPEQWRSIVVTGSAFPRNLAGLKPGRHIIERLDWKLYQMLLHVQSRLQRSLWYGDYGIAHWELPDIDVTKMQMSANLRYTDDDDWVVFRGRSVNTDGYEQYIDLCDLLVSDAVYKGKGFSMGDANYAAAIETGKPGNASCWRRDATNHHITMAVSQLSSLGAI